MDSKKLTEIKFDGSIVDFDDKQFNVTVTNENTGEMDGLFLLKSSDQDTLASKLVDIPAVKRFVSVQRHVALPAEDMGPVKKKRQSQPLDSCPSENAKKSSSTMRKIKR
jgi:hypothetical protein